jgi:predicted AAA+ superfamily ATPase
MAGDTLSPRFAERRLAEALEDSPVVLIQGPRQCGKTTLAQMVGTSENLAAPFQVSRPTIRDYITLLERVFLLEQLPPWHSDRLKRLIKTPKLHSLLGQPVETFVYQLCEISNI